MRLLFASGRASSLVILRGLTGAIADRYDLTLECIRHYVNVNSPLAPALSRYAAFFALFGDLYGYVSFILLNNVVTDDLSVKFFMVFDDFHKPSVPGNVDIYNECLGRSFDFINSRNVRIQEIDVRLDRESS